jgi:hypothetical protein
MAQNQMHAWSQGQERVVAISPSSEIQITKHGSGMITLLVISGNKRIKKSMSS